MHSKHVRTGLFTIAASTGAATFAVLAATGAASAAAGGPVGWRPHFNGSCIRVAARTSGAFSNNQDILSGWVVPGSVSVVATQGTTPGQDTPPVTTFGPNTGYTVSPNWHTVTLQSPYAGSNDGFTTYYSVFKRTCYLPGSYRLRTETSGAFSNNEDILNARNIIRGSVFVVATQGQTPGQDNPSVNGFLNGHGYTVTYTRNGAIATLQSPFAGSNDGFTTYYTVLRHF